MTKSLSLSIRIDLPNGGRIGPGKIGLLRAIDDEGSLRGAAAAMNMSYPRALKLINDMNDNLREPVIVTSHGGAERGGAELTTAGAGLIKSYDLLCKQAATSCKKQIGAIAAFLPQKRE